MIVGVERIRRAATGTAQLVEAAVAGNAKQPYPEPVRVAAEAAGAVIPVIVDVVAMTELPKAGIAVRRITAEPPERLVDVYLSTGQAIVTVARRGDPTVVTFGNVATRG